MEHEPEVARLGLLALEDISNALGLKPRKVLLYVEQGIIEPTTPSGGRGIRRRFSLLDLAQFIVATRLDDIGIKPRRMRSIMEGIRVAVMEAQRPPAILLIDADSTGDRIRTFYEGQSYVEALMGGDVASIVIDWKRAQEQAIRQSFAASVPISHRAPMHSDQPAVHRS